MPFVIGITGGSGSGKTCFVSDLAENFQDDEMSVLTMDNYYLLREQQETDENGIKNFDLPGSIHLEDFVRDLLLLKKGKEVIREEYTFNNELKTPQKIVVKPAKIILVEGLFILSHKPLSNLLDAKIFIDAKDNVKVIRRIKRDRVERNYPLDDVLYRYQNHVMPSFETYIKPFIGDVDIIINNNTSYATGLDIVSGFCKSKLLA